MKLINMCVFLGIKHEKYPLGIALYSLSPDDITLTYWLIDKMAADSTLSVDKSWIDTGNYRLATKEDNQIIKEYYK